MPKTKVNDETQLEKWGDAAGESGVGMGNAGTQRPPRNGEKRSRRGGRSGVGESEGGRQEVGEQETGGGRLG